MIDWLQGILYSGKKVDTWFSIDRNTGRKHGALNYLGQILKWTVSVISRTLHAKIYNVIYPWNLIWSKMWNMTSSVFNSDNFAIASYK